MKSNPTKGLLKINRLLGKMTSASASTISKSLVVSLGGVITSLLEEMVVSEEPVFDKAADALLEDIDAWLDSDGAIPEIDYDLIYGHLDKTVRKRIKRTFSNLTSSIDQLRADVKDAKVSTQSTNGVDALKKQLADIDKRLARLSKTSAELTSAYLTANKKWPSSQTSKPLTLEDPDSFLTAEVVKGFTQLGNIGDDFIAKDAAAHLMVTHLCVIGGIEFVNSFLARDMSHEVRADTLESLPTDRRREILAIVDSLGMVMRVGDIDDLAELSLDVPIPWPVFASAFLRSLKSTPFESKEAITRDPTLGPWYTLILNKTDRTIVNLSSVDRIRAKLRALKETKPKSVWTPIRKDRP